MRAICTGADRAVSRRVIAHADELTALDQAIGDGDHGLNMKRGFEAVRAELERIAAKPLPEALKAIGTQLVMKVGAPPGRSTARCSWRWARRSLRDRAADLARRRSARRSTRSRRAASRELGPEDHARRADAACRQPSPKAARTCERGCRSSPQARAEATMPMLATRGPRLVSRRALDRAYGPGRAVVGADGRGGVPRRWRPEHDRRNVGIVIVSHSPKVAEGAADMVRQMVGDEVTLACMRRRSGRRAWHRASARSWRAIDRAWSEAGWPCWSISAARKRTAKWRSKCSTRSGAAACVDLQRADRRGRGDGRDGGVRRFDRWRPSGARPRSCPRNEGRGNERRDRRRTGDRLRRAHQRGGSACAAFGQAHQLAKTFDCRVEIALSADGPGWTPRAR